MASLGPNSKMTPRNIMSAILQTPSPVVNHRAVNTRYGFLRMLTAKQFTDAANRLQTEHFGTIQGMSGSGYRQSVIFVKKSPEEEGLLDAILANFDLCSLEEYVKKYHQPLPKSYAGSLRVKIVSMGLAKGE